MIGSGIGGLSTATILAKAGKKVLVLEQHDQAGGCCHTYIDKGFEFDVGKRQMRDILSLETQSWKAHFKCSQGGAAERSFVVVLFILEIVTLTVCAPPPHPPRNEFFSIENRLSNASFRKPYKTSNTGEVRYFISKKERHKFWYTCMFFNFRNSLRWRAQEQHHQQVDD